MIDFKDAQLLSYSQESRFLGDATFRFGVVKNLSVKGDIDNFSNTYGVSGIWSGRNALVRSAQDWHDVIINGHNLGLGRILSFDFEEGTNVQHLPYTVNLEIYDTGSFYNMTGEYFSGISGVFQNPSLAIELLDSISESFDFSIGRDGQYTASQSLNVRYLSGDATSPILRAKLLASGIMNAAAPFGFINSAHSGFFNQAGRRLYRETYNEITYECSFEKTFSVIDLKTGYGASISQSINTNSDGITSVSEQGEIVGVWENVYNSMLSGLSLEVSNSFSRCSGVYAFYQAGNPYVLNSTPLQLARVIDRFEGKGSYDVTYSNDPKNLNNYSWEYTLSYDKDQNGIYTVSENGTIIGLKETLGTPAKFNKAYSGYQVVTPGILSRVTNLYNETTSLGYALHLISKEISVNRYQGQIGYDWSYSDDRSIVDESLIFRKSVEATDNKPTRLFGVFRVTNVDEIVQDGKQSNFGNYEVDINFDLKRVSGDANYNVATLRGIAVGIATDLKDENVNGSDIHEASCSYTINDLDRTFQFNVVWNYIDTMGLSISPQL